VPCIAEAIADQAVQGIGFPILFLFEEGDGGDGILDAVEGLNDLFASGAPCLLRHPLGIHLLDVGRVGQHDPRELRRGGRRDDPALEALPDQARYKPRVVDVGVGQKDAFDLPGAEAEGLAVELVGLETLVHPAVHEELPAVYGEVKTRPCDFSRRAEEGDLHEEASQSFEW
jgi:hypothetical protein